LYPRSRRILPDTSSYASIFSPGVTTPVTSSRLSRIRSSSSSVGSRNSLSQRAEQALPYLLLLLDQLQHRQLHARRRREVRLRLVPEVVHRERVRRDLHPCLRRDRRGVLRVRIERERRVHQPRVLV